MASRSAIAEISALAQWRSCHLYCAVEVVPSANCRCEWAAASVLDGTGLVIAIHKYERPDAVVTGIVSSFI